ncbi:MAG TPA: hypothetical protein PKW35_06660, partial [Nannocystaceae bacterium]|nr:hypothetical protein [Nannocystaceae bacterium]
TTSTTDAGTTADATTGGALLFDCHGCGCDAATHYCVTVLGGGLPGLLPGDLTPCPDVVDPYLDGCHPFPAPCVDDPSCACLGDIPGCFCDEQPDHAHVTCPLP